MENETSSLYRKYRPQRFGDVVGQKPVVHALLNAAKNDRFSHAYLFSGPRGTGKTTSARLLAKAANCEALEPNGEPCNVCDSCVAITQGTSSDVIEYDAATNSGVDAIRDILADVSLASMGKRKVYIFDEVQMFSASAANAFLKTLEEPPAHVIFVLATTDPHKVLATIRSRCQTHSFSLVDPEVLQGYFKQVAAKENLDVSEQVIDTAVYQARGSVRDGLSALDGLLVSDAVQVPHTWEIVRGMAAGDLRQVFQSVAVAHKDGTPARVLAEEIVDVMREFFFIQMGATNLLSTPEWPGRTTLAKEMGPKRTVQAIELLGDAISSMQANYDQRVNLEIALARFCKMR